MCQVGHLLRSTDYIFLRKHRLVDYIISDTSNLRFSVSENLLVQLFAGKCAFDTRWNTLFARHDDMRGGGWGGSGAIATFTQNADSRWTWVVICMVQQLYHYGKYNRHTVNRRVVGPQGQSGRFEVDLNFRHYLESNQDCSWFQTFAVFWKLYAFFWVIPRRLNFICRRFGTLCLFHLHRQVGMKND